MTSETTADRINYSSLAGEIDVRVVSRTFRGGAITSVFGDTFVDLRCMDLAPGVHTLRVNGVLGTCTVLLPRDLAFSVSANTLIGRVSVESTIHDGVAPAISFQTPGYPAAVARLVIEASQVFGNVDIRRES